MLPPCHGGCQILLTHVVRLSTHKLFVVVEIWPPLPVAVVAFDSAFNFLTIIAHLRDQASLIYRILLVELFDQIKPFISAS